MSKIAPCIYTSADPSCVEGACQAYSCSRNGQCTEDDSDPKGYTCSCDNGYSGDRCQYGILNGQLHELGWSFLFFSFFLFFFFFVFLFFFFFWIELQRIAHSVHVAPEAEHNEGGIRLIVGFQPLMVISPTASWIRPKPPIFLRLWCDAMGDRIPVSRTPSGRCNHYMLRGAVQNITNRMNVMGCIF